MAEKKYVRMSKEQQMLVLGQIGNLDARIKAMERVLREEAQWKSLSHLQGISEELKYLKEYFSLDVADFPFPVAQTDVGE